MPSASKCFIQKIFIGALLSPLAWAARPVFDFDQSSSSSSFAKESQHAHATLTVNEIEKFEVVEISKKEMMRLRTKGMRLHEVKHRHFNRDPKGPNSMHEEYEDDSVDSNAEVFAVTPRGQFHARPSKKTLANALLEKEAGNATMDGPWFSKSVTGCSDHVKSQWYDLNFAIRDKGNGHFYLKCEGQADGEELKASCIPKECGGDEWCFVKRGCGGWVSRSCRKMDGIDKRQCQKSSTTKYIRPGGQDYTTATTTTTGEPSTENEAFSPPSAFSPSQMTGFVCAQFDLDLTVLSGGVFPGMFSVGLLGDVHYIPSTKCWGWTNELYLQFSLGLDIGGVSFRISFVFIATLVVTEQPLNAARDQLSWELPYRLDTSVCHTKDPFTLIERTLRRQWKYILTHVLTLRETPEEKVTKALQKYDKENNFEDYIPLLSEDGGPKLYPGHIEPKGTGYSQDTETQALIAPGSKGAGVGRLDINLTREGKSIKLEIRVVEVPDDAKMLKVIVWQDWEAMITRQESKEFPLLDKAGNLTAGQITWSFQLRGQNIVVGGIHLLSSGGSPAHIGPFTIGTMTYVKVGPVRSGEDPMLQRSYSQLLEIGCRPFIGQEVGHSGTLAITSINLTNHNCRHQPDSVRLSIRTAADRMEEATWHVKDMGRKAPWGVHVTRRHGMQDVPNEAVKLLNGLKPIVSLENLLVRDVAAILKAGLKAASKNQANYRWHPIWIKFVWHVRKALELPASSALNMIGRGPVMEFVQTLLWALRNSELNPDDLDLNLAIFISQLQYRLEGYKPSLDNQNSWKWSHLVGRSVNADPQQCMRVAADEALNNTKECKEKCREKRPVVCKDKACTQGRLGFEGKPRAICNVARTDIADGICSLWHCISWDNFPHVDAYEIEALLPEDDILASPMPFSEILKHITKDQLADSIQELTNEEFRGVVDGAAKLKKANDTWYKTVTRAVLPEKEEITPGSFEPDWKLLNSRALKDVLISCLVVEDGWPRLHQITTLLKAEFGHNETAVPVKIMVEDSEGRSGRRSLSFAGKLGVNSNEWTQNVEISSYNCKVNAKIEWKWQLSPPQDGFFKRPKLVGVSQALFAAYDQFASKLPAYGAQVQERLDPQPEKGWFDFSGSASVLPYKTSDGRFLHRHLKKGEHENLKVHAGDLGTDDAVYNFPKAWEKSKYRKTPSFQYNAGLSLANLFLRVVSDFQALFFLYFANHPDWDGQCASLPPKFNLFHEHPKREHTWERTNWEGETESSTSSWWKRDDDLAAPPITHRAGSTVSDLGKKMTEDDLTLFQDWHWVSKPYWFGKDEKRAGFMTKTSPTHGKDGWATDNVSALSAEMWPHIWCELVNQYWVKDETDIAAKQTEEESARAAHEVDELLFGAEAEGVRMSENSASITSQMIKSLQSLKIELTSMPFRCIVEEGDNYKQSEITRFVTWQLRDAERAYAESLNHSEKVGQLFQEVVNFLRVDLHQAEKVEDEEQAKAMQAEIAKLESTAKTLVNFRADLSTEKGRLGRIKAAVFLSWKLSSSDTTPDPGTVAKYRAQFLQNKKDMELSQEERANFLQEAQGQIERLLKNYPNADPRDDDNDGVTDGFAGIREFGDLVVEDSEDVQEEGGDVEQPSPDRLEDIRKALKFSGLLLTSVKTSQKRLLEEFQLMHLCVDLVGRPPALAQQRFLPWVPLEHKDRRTRLKGVFNNLLKDVDTATNIDGIDLWYEKACRVSIDFNFSSTSNPADILEDEPRHECERVQLSKQLITIFPSFAERVVISFKRIQEHLDKLILNPTNQTVYKGLEGVVRGFVEYFKSSEDLDNDFLTAFAYKSDGSLSGDLWVALKDSSATIVASLQERTSSNRNWITESIRDRAFLQQARRMRVRNPEPLKPEIPANSESCVCRDDWTAWVWYTFPVRRRFTGCSEFPTDGGKMSWSSGGMFSSGTNTSGWKGFCRTQTKRNSLAHCAEEWAPCDPNVTVDTRPEFKIWRRDHARGVVTLPLVQTDLYMSFDVRSSRADFCTPNFAPILIKKTKQWSSASWVPWELRKVDCYGARLHPPGISLLVMRCEHGLSGVQTQQPRSVEWQVVVTAYLISYYNTWGTADGDMTQSWFDGSWGGAAADKGFPGVLTGTSTWANTGAGFGYMNTANVMQSGAAFWFAMIAEMLGVFQTTKAISDSRTGNTGSAGGALGTLTLMAASFWKVMQTWGCIPLAWGMSIGAGAVIKYLSDILPVDLSGWRNEHDVILAVQWTFMSTKTVRKAKDLIRDLSKGQLEQAIKVGEKVLPFSQYWKDHQKLVGNTPDHIHHLSHKMLQLVVKTWIEEVSSRRRENAFGTCTERMFQNCEIRPRWYKVSKKNKINVHAFYGTNFEKWLDDKRKPDESLFLIQTGKGWYREILDPSEEDHFYPEDYIKRGALEVHYDTIDVQGFNHRQMTHHQLDWLLKASDKKDLQCWATVARNQITDILEIVKDKYPELIGQDEDNVVGVGYFAREYTAKFFMDTWKKHVNDTNKEKLATLLFKRDDSTKYKFYASKAKESNWFNRNNWGVSLQLLHRIGLSFIKIPMLFQVQPYMQLAIAFNVKQIVGAIQSRMGTKKGPSMLREHKARVEACRACVRMKGSAFCDRHSVATSMLKNGWSPDMDECMPKTLESKASCQSFVWTPNKSKARHQAVGVFKDQMCPCYNQRSGERTGPRWITSESHCAEMRWPNADSEDDRRQMKADDWKLGFTNIGKQREDRLSLGDTLDFQGQSKGCDPGYECCQSWHQGEEIHRCIERASITKATHWWYRQKCYNYHPTDIVTDKAWAKVQPFRCAPTKMNGGSGFNGSWKYHDGKWVEKALAAKVFRRQNMRDELDITEE